MEINKFLSILAVSAVLLSIVSKNATAMSTAECRNNPKCYTKCLGKAEKEYDKAIKKATKANDKLKKNNIKNNKGPLIAGLSSKPSPSTSGTKAAGVGDLYIKTLHKERTIPKLEASLTYKHCAASQKI